MTTPINLSGISELDFTNGIASVSTTDDVTTITLEGTEVQVNGVDTTAQTPINFESGTNITVSNPSAGNIKIDGPSSLPPSGTAGGDLSGTYPNPTVAKVNGAAIPASQPFVGTNSSNQIVAATAGALPAGTTATTQTQGDGSTKVATDAYVDTGLATKQATLTGTGIARNTGACTELSGDATTSGSNAVSVVKVNGAAVPASQPFVGTNGSNQIVAATAGTLPSGTVLSTVTRNSQTGTSYAILSSDGGKIVEVANATASTIVALTIAQAGTGGFVDGWFCYINNKGTNAAKLTPATSIVGGCAVLIIPAGADCLIYSDGSNYQVLADGVTVPALGAGFFSDGVPLNGPQSLVTATISSSAAFSASGSQVKAHMFVLPSAIPVSKNVTNISTLSGGGFAYVGIYDSNKNLITSAKISTASTGVVTTTMATSYLLLSGTYYYAFGADNTVASAAAWSVQTNPQQVIYNANYQRCGTCANAISGGAMPATLGTITSASIINILTLWES